MELHLRRCRPCRSGDPPLAPDIIDRLAREIPGWATEGQRLTKRFDFPDFVTAMAFVNRLAAVAEAEGHHPDFAVHYSRVDVSIWTHAIGGLSENDFILAARLDRL